jgi:ubiquitin-large subunit ribosomal protein L40e
MDKKTVLAPLDGTVGDLLDHVPPRERSKLRPLNHTLITPINTVDYNRIIFMKPAELARRALLKTAQPRRTNQIFIRDLAGKTKTFDVDLSERGTFVVEFKIMVAEREGIDPEQQRLIFAGRQLADDGRLHDNKITEFSSLHLVLRLCGC